MSIENPSLGNGENSAQRHLREMLEKMTPAEREQWDLEIANMRQGFAEEQAKFESAQDEADSEFNKLTSKLDFDEETSQN